MRPNSVVVHASDLDCQSFAGCLAQGLRLLPAAWIEINVSMVTSDCTHVIVLMCRPGRLRAGLNSHLRARSHQSNCRMPLAACAQRTAGGSALQLTPANAFAVTSAEGCRVRRQYGVPARCHRTAASPRQ